MTTIPRQGFATTRVFDFNLLPYPFERVNVVSRDATGNPTVIDFYDGLHDDFDSISDEFGGTKVFTMFIKRNVSGDWEDVAIKKYRNG